MRALPLLFVGILALSFPAMAASGPVAGGIAPADTQADAAPNPCVGTIEERPDEETLVSIQGARATPDGYQKKPALLVSYGPDGSFRWARNASLHGRWWAYDVDRLPNGNVLFVTTQSGGTIVGELDPTQDEYVWTEEFDGDPEDDENPQVTDAHDADLVGSDELVIADKGEGHERLLVYNLTRGEVVWEWRFEDHPEYYPEDGGGPADDWTHVNDVDRVGEDWFMASVRNFDQIAFVNRTTGEVELTLGEDDEHDVLHEQHNPDHMWGPNGEHTVLVADSLNDRVVEYEYDEESDEWDRVWEVTGLEEPRDADRLANGNTLVADRMGHRTVEVTPEGRVVWEVYTPYETYDAERGGPGSDGPTMREHDVEGNFDLHNEAEFDTADVEACASALYEFAPSKLDQFVSWVTGDDAHRAADDQENDGAESVNETQGDTPNVDRTGTDGPDRSLLVAGGAALVAVVVGIVGFAARRRR